MGTVSIHTMMTYQEHSWTREQARAVDDEMTALWREAYARFPRGTVRLAKIRVKGEPELVVVKIKVMDVRVRIRRVEIQGAILAPDELRGGVRQFSTDLIEL